MTVSVRASLCLNEELSTVKRYASKWLLNAMTHNIEYDDEFFDVAIFLAKDSRTIIKAIENAIYAYAEANRIKKLPKSELEGLHDYPKSRFGEVYESIMEEYHKLRKPIIACVKSLLNENIDTGLAVTGKGGVLNPLKKLFGLDTPSVEFCYFAFSCRNYDPIRRYFINTLEVNERSNAHLLSAMFGIDMASCDEIRCTLDSMGIVYFNDDDICLARTVDKFIKSRDQRKLSDLFCSPLPASDIPFEDFNIEDGEKEHIVRLLQRKHSEPCNILLYGAPGVGKSSFVRALATKINVKAFDVICRNSDTNKDRRAALIACLNIARRYPGSFVVVDEAEKMLDTWLQDSDLETTKAWLNALLETRGNRIIWICNWIRHLDPAVRRRFAYSVKFRNLSTSEQIKMWEKASNRLHVVKKLPLDAIKRLVDRYNVPVSCMESSIRQAKAIATKAAFVPCIERTLEAYVTLINNGQKPVHRNFDANSYILDGISTSMPVEAFMGRVRRIKECFKLKDRAKPGTGNILFYGVSGAGKSELCKYVAKTLDLPILMKRASDLLSPWIGEAEKNLALAFRQAEDEGAVLVLDEADSFIPSRQNATRSWEVTQTNEFLTSLEQFTGLCICTTNFRECMDSAVMRRFSMKIEFRYAQKEQLEVLYRNIMTPLVGYEPPQDMLETLYSQKHLCAGDFQTVKNQYWLEEQGKITHQMLLEALLREEKLKLETGVRKLGFAV